MNSFFVEKLLATLLVAAVSVLADPLHFFWQNKNRDKDEKDDSEEDDDDDDKDYLKYVYVVIGVIGAFLLLFIVFWCLCKSKKKKNTVLATIRKPSAENNPIKPSAPSQLYSIANNSYTGPVRGASLSGSDFSSEHSYQQVVYENNNYNGKHGMGHMAMGPPPPYFEHEGRAPEYTPSVATLADTHNSKSKQ